MALTIIRNTLSLRFMRQLVETAAGRAHNLNQVADAEDNGESQIFERILAEVEDPVLRKVISRHQADEVRHAALLRARCEATGVDVGPVPMSIRLIARLDAAAGGCSTRTIRTHSDVMEAYVLLQVIEERAITQFSLRHDHRVVGGAGPSPDPSQRLPSHEREVSVERLEHHVREHPHALPPA